MRARARVRQCPLRSRETCTEVCTIAGFVYVKIRALSSPRNEKLEIGFKGDRRQRGYLTMTRIWTSRPSSTSFGEMLPEGIAVLNTVARTLTSGRRCYPPSRRLRPCLRPCWNRHIMGRSLRSLFSVLVKRIFNKRKPKKAVSSCVCGYLRRSDLHRIIG